MIYYCTKCWNEIDKGTIICPYCTADQTELEQEKFSVKLIRALNHPEPETIIRATEILAELKVKEAIPELLSKLENEKDPYIVKAIVEALIKLDKKLLYKIKEIIGQEPPVIIRNSLGNL
jgi:HEAT repeat protein